MGRALPEEWFVSDRWVNAAIAWAFSVVSVGVAVVSFLQVLFVEMALAAIAAFVAVTPAVVYRSWTWTVPWPLLLVTALTLAVGTFRPALFDDLITGFSEATLAMLVVVALELTTAVRMTPQFAVFFTVIATLATAGFWAVGAAPSAAFLGTTFVSTNGELMAVFTATLVAGIFTGILFRLYFRRRLATDAERSEEVAT